MSETTQVVGFNAKLLINDVNYVAAKITVRETVDEGDVTSFESVVSSSLQSVFEERKPTKRRAEVTVEKATFDTADNPFIAPYFVEPDRTITLLWFKDGNPDQARLNRWSFPILLVLSVDDSADVAQLQPVSFTGKTDGPYFRPGEL